MDSLTQMALGAAVGGAVLGRRLGPRAFAWGAVCGTLPDLDVLISHGDPIRDFTFHRAETHAYFYQTLATPLVAWGLHRLHRAQATYRDWLLFVWLCLITHATLDAFTVYGTQLFLPFSDYPVGLGSVFIIDPLYTLPLLIGIVAALVLSPRTRAGLRTNAAGLALSSLYLGWSVAAQSHVEGVVHRTLAATGTHDGRVLVTPTPFNTLLWRVVVMDESGFREGYRSLLDPPGPVALEPFESDIGLLSHLRDNWDVQRLAWFSKGFYAVQLTGSSAATRRVAGDTNTIGALGAAHAASADRGGAEAAQVVIADLRMGQVPWFVFTFAVAELVAGEVRPIEPRQLPVERPTSAVLSWLWNRIADPQAGSPPRA